MGVDRSGPQTGDWYILPQSVIRVSKEYPDHVRHRWIVAQIPYAGEVKLMLRTTKPTYGDRSHDAHDPTHYRSCSIDEPGHLCKPIQLHPEKVLADVDFSCPEPDDDIREYVMKCALPSRRPKVRRSERR